MNKEMVHVQEYYFPWYQQSYMGRNDRYILLHYTNAQQPAICQCVYGLHTCTCTPIQF